MEEYEDEIAQALAHVAHQIRNLGNAGAATPMGGLEALGKVFEEGFARLAESISEIGSSLDDLAEAIQRLGKSQ